MARNKEAIVSFKAEESLLEALRLLPNRSAFIRSAILAALENTCPLCQGMGILSPEQKSHWESFTKGHEVTQCSECHQPYLVCAHDSSSDSHHGGSKPDSPPSTPEH